MLLKCTGLVVTFRLLCFEMPISQRQGAKRHLAEQTHTHTSYTSYMRCLKDTATAQKLCSQNITHFFGHGKKSFEQKAALTFTVLTFVFLEAMLNGMV